MSSILQTFSFVISEQRVNNVRMELPLYRWRRLPLVGGLKAVAMRLADWVLLCPGCIINLFLRNYITFISI